MAAMDAGCKRVCAVLHRRAGKDITMLHQTAKMAMKTPGVYYHMLPTYSQGKKIIFDAVMPTGERLIDWCFPGYIRKKPPNETEMSIELINGSVVQVVGADTYNRLVGTNPLGVTFSEYALTSPIAWDFFRPILAENGGWAAFIYTPRGYNHGFDLYQMARDNEDWYADLQTVEDTAAIPLALIQSEREAGMPESLILQEFYCDFSVANVGSIFGTQVGAADNEGRISDAVLFDPRGADVVISTDLGFTDSTALWFWQPTRDGYRILHYLEGSGLTSGDWFVKVSEVLEEKSWKCSKWYLPHDARAKSLQTGRSVIEELLSYGAPCEIVPNMRVNDLINAGRMVLSQCRFSKTACKEGLAALRHWAYKYNEDTKSYSAHPVHDWSSHGATAFYYGALMMQRERPAKAAEAKPYRTMHSFKLDELWGTADGATSGRRA